MPPSATAAAGALPAVAAEQWAATGSDHRSGIGCNKIAQVAAAGGQDQLAGLEVAVVEPPCQPALISLRTSPDRDSALAGGWRAAGRGSPSSSGRWRRAPRKTRWMAMLARA